jgi:UPF0176 protein
VEAKPAELKLKHHTKEIRDMILKMKNPLSTPSYTMLSFYTFENIESPDVVVSTLQELWTPFKVYGRIYVAREGVNAQMGVPTNILSEFRTICREFNLFRNIELNVDHVLSAEEFYRSRPFKSLHIRHRKQIVTDGLSSPLDWSDAGRELSREQWDELITSYKHSDARAVMEAEDTPPLSSPPIILDCRNTYESDIGRFDGAIPLNTVRFQDSWEVLNKALEGRKKEELIMTYCTGGIR